MTMKSMDAEDRATLAPAAALFGSLSDPTRLAILLALRREEARVVDLTIALGLAQSTVSKHLDCLRCCGLVESRPVGRASMFSIAQPGIDELLSGAQTLLDATGNAVALCTTYGAEPDD